MRYPLKSSESTAVVLDVIRELTGDTTYATFKAIVSATIKGKLKIDDVNLTNSRPNYALIDIMWEDCGYKNYQNMGLFGRMSTQWQEVKKVGTRTFRIFDDSYQIDVTY